MSAHSLADIDAANSVGLEHLEVQIWLLTLDPVHPVDEHALLCAGLINLHEITKADQYRNQQARAQFIAGRSLARYALAQRANVSPHRIAFLLDANGKPYASDLAWHFNLSHSAHLIACAVAASPVGIDVEHRQRHIEHLSIAQHYFSSTEYGWLSGKQQHDSSRFLALWTLKEAYLKALGIGISSGLAAMSWQIRSAKLFRVDSPLSQQTWYCRLLQAIPDYWLSLCCQEPITRCQIKRMNLIGLTQNCDG